MKTTFTMLLAKTIELLGVEPIMHTDALELDIQRLSALKKGGHTDDDCLYTTESSKLSGVATCRWPKQIFCVANTDLPDMEGFGGNIAVFPLSVGRQELAEAVSCAAAYYGCWQRDIMDMVYAGRSLDEIVVFAHEYFKNPILVYDSSLKVLSYTKDEDVGEKMWSNTVQNRAVTDMDAKEAVELRKYVELVDSNERPFRHKAPSLARPFYSCNIMLGGKRVGMVDVMEKNHAIEKYELDMLENFCYVLSFELQKDSVLRENLGSTYHLLLTDLLSGNISGHEALMSRMAAVRWDTFKYFRVLSFVPINTYMTDREFSTIFDSMRTMNMHGKGIIFDGCIVYIISSGNPRTLSDTDMASLSSFCARGGLRCGISDVYTDILHSHLLYPQSKLALNYSSDNVILFENVRFTNLLNYCGKYERPAEIMDPAVKRLAYLDAGGATEYLKTLRVFFKTGGNQVLAAQELCIHRTTMAYRLQKLSEMAGIDFSNQEQLLHIQFSIALFDYLNQA